MGVSLRHKHDFGFEDLHLGGTLHTDYIQMGLTPPAGVPGEGKIYWNATDGTVNIGMPGGEVNLQVGQELIVRVKNDEGSIISNGEAVYVSGATGNVIEVKKPIASNTTTAPLTFGLATEDLPTGGFGYVTLIGNVRDVDTDGGAENWSDGDVVYLSSTVSGGKTNVRPAAPNIAVVLGVVLRAHSSAGVIAFNPVVVQRVSLSSDVLLTNLQDADVLQWDAAVGYWKNVALP